MTEWYVLLEGTRPISIHMGRRDAAGAMVDSFRLTEREAKALKRWHHGVMPDLGVPFVIVAWERPDGTWTKDRALVRVLGPGTEV